MARSRQKQLDRIGVLETEVRDLRKRVDEITPQPFTVYLSTLPEPLKLRRDIPVLMEFNGDDFVATFVEAQISASGDDEAEAAFNLKDMIVSIFDLLSSMPEAKLGIIPKRQLAVLRSLIQKVE